MMALLLISLQYCYSAEKRIVLSTGISILLNSGIKTGRISNDLPVIYGNVQQIERVLQKNCVKRKIW